MVILGCIGWNLNGVLVYVVELMLGFWVMLGDLCIGGEDEEF